MRFLLIAAFFLFLSLLTIIFLVNREHEIIKVDLQKKTEADGNREMSEEMPLRVVISSMISPEETIVQYKKLVDFIGSRMGRRVELVLKRNYTEANELLKTGAVDMGFICSGGYIFGKRDSDIRLLAAPVVKGETFYYSQIIVPASGGVSDFKELKGKSFVYVDLLSNTGRLYPRHLVSQLGFKEQDFFANIIYSGSHDRSIEMVAEGLADGAAVDNLVLDSWMRKNPDLARNVRIIHTSPPFGIPPFVVTPHISPADEQKLRLIMLSMDSDSEGKEVLRGLNIESFKTVDDSLYDSIRELMDEETF